MGPPSNIPGDFARITGRVSEGEPKAIPYSKENAERAPGHEGGQEKRNISHATCTPSLEKAERAKIQKIPFSAQPPSVCFSVLQYRSRLLAQLPWRARGTVWVCARVKRASGKEREQERPCFRLPRAFRKCSLSFHGPCSSVPNRPSMQHFFLLPPCSENSVLIILYPLILFLCVV